MRFYNALNPNAMQSEVKIIHLTLTQEEFSQAVEEAAAKLVAPVLQKLEALCSQQRDSLTTAQAAKRAGVSVNTLKNYIVRGRLHPKRKKPVCLPASVTEGGHYRISREELDNFQSLFSVHRTA